MMRQWTFILTGTAFLSAAMFGGPVQANTILIDTCVPPSTCLPTDAKLESSLGGDVFYGFTNDAGGTSFTNALLFVTGNSGDQSEIDKLNDLANTTFTTLIKDTSPENPFEVAAGDYFLIKIGSPSNGPDTAFFQNVSSETLSLTYTDLISGGGGGLSHVSFFNVATVPGPIVGAGLPGLIMACGGLLALSRRRRQKIA
jgi:hypothetical protein